MALRIQTNIAALNAHRNLAISDTGMAKSLERLSSGYRVNRAADDAAGLAMSNKFITQIRSMAVASRNASQANSLLQIAEGGTDQISSILQRLKELATQAASANSAQNLSDINTEATALKAEIDRIANSTTFQGTSLLTGWGTHTSTKTFTVDNTYDFSVVNATAATYSVAASAGVSITIKNLTTSVSQTLTVAAGANTYDFSSMGISFKTSINAAVTVASLAAAALDGVVVGVTDATFQIGETNTSNYQISFQIAAATKASLSVDTQVDLSTASGASTAMGKIDAAIGALNTLRASIGATMNRLDYTAANLATATENASAANSVIKDVDMAAEMTSFTKNQILVQAGTSMLAQANSSPQLVLSLFGGR